MPDNIELTPLILIVDEKELHSRDLERVLQPKGHVVLKASTGQQALDLSSKVSPDVILLARHLPDSDGIDLIRALKASTTIHDTTPILIVAETPLGKAERLDALAAGAWDILEHPVDANELVLRLDTFVRAKQETDRVRDEALTDPGTGFYNVRGILQRTRELSADAARSGRPITCIAVGSHHQEALEPEGDSDQRGALDGRMSAALLDVTRASDSLGRLAANEFIIVAPGTCDEGAVRLADRLLEALQRRHDSAGEPAKKESSLRAGLCSMAASDNTAPEDLLLRATMALRKAQQDDGSFRVRAYEA